MFVEVLVDAIDEDCDWRTDRPQPWHEMTVSVGAAALKLLRGEVEEADEMIYNPVQLFVCYKPSQAGTDLYLSSVRRSA